MSEQTWLSEAQLKSERDLFERRLHTSEECRENLFAAMVKANLKVERLSEAVKQLADEMKSEDDWRLAAYADRLLTLLTDTAKERE